MNEMGTLFIVATPIGNLQDITFRAVEVLKTVDVILAEDTRHTGLLLNHYSISTRMLPFHEYNEQQKEDEVIEKLKNGLSIALVSDAGTPLISDPGFKTVRRCVSEGIPVQAIPGPSAATAALSVAGLPSDKFLFIGFLPEKAGKRQKLLEQIKIAIKSDDAENHLRATVILYESPYHIQRTLGEIQAAFGDISVVICRELTKIHEETFHGTVQEALAHFKNPKGEFVVLI